MPYLPENRLSVYQLLWSLKASADAIALRKMMSIDLIGTRVAPWCVNYCRRKLPIGGFHDCESLERIHET